MTKDELKQKLDEFNEYLNEHRIRSMWLSAIALWRELHPELENLLNDKKVNGEDNGE